MKMQEWRTEDKSDWGSGPWHDEPDKKQWRDEATGLPCLIVRGPMGALCGYVGVPESHPWHGKQYNDCLLPTAAPRGVRESDGDGTLRCFCDPAQPDRKCFYCLHTITKLVCGDDWCSHSAEYKIDVHGGLTFSDACRQTGDPSRGICHESDDDDNVWWFGFDCAHLGDECPKPSISGFQPSSSPTRWYKTMSYVEAEVAKLAAQIAERQ